MLVNVLKENCKVSFRDYGTFEIPKGTKVYKTAGHEPECFLISASGWIDEKYPEKRKKLKADIIKYGIYVSPDILMPALRLRFLYDDQGYCRDIFKDINGSRKFCRMESHHKNKAGWYTLTDDWEEPDCPLRCDILLQVVNEEGEVIFTEQQEKIDGEYVSEKTFPFSWETKEESIPVYTG